MNTTLVILAAGLGSRFGGNKQISHVGPHDEFLMEYSIYDAIEAGFTQIVFVLKADMVEGIRNTIGEKIARRVRVDYAVQDYSSLPEWYSLPADRTKPFGTVHAVLCAKEVIRGSFVTVNADDYYGKEAFRIAHRLLCELQGKGEACMVPYILANTMSENGGVTRGICRLENGMLQEVTETREIHYENGTIVGEFGSLGGDEKVSMNMWGFHDAFLEDMDAYFKDFLRVLPDGEIKAECLLPIMVQQFLSEKRLAVRAEESHDHWFGITYQADRETVKQELLRLHEGGAYPNSLY